MTDGKPLVIGQLTLLGLSTRAKRNDRLVYAWRCSCGQVTYKTFSAARSGSQSCGCRNRQQPQKNKTNGTPWPPCQNCGQRPGNRPRGLCHRCYMQPEVRAEYLTVSERRLGTAQPDLPGDFYQKAPLGQPTDCLPGSPEKVKVMSQRAARGQALFHPEDANANSR